MSELHCQLDHSVRVNEYVARGQLLNLRMTREMICNPEGLNPDPDLECLRAGRPLRIELHA